MGCGVYDGVRFSMLTLIWCIIGATIILPVVFRGKRWLRFIGVLAMLGVAQFAWLGVETSARLARDIVRRDGGALVDDFDLDEPTQIVKSPERLNVDPPRYTSVMTKM